jgi:hypothetical protein
MATWKRRLSIQLGEFSRGSSAVQDLFPIFCDTTETVDHLVRDLKS